MVALSGAGASAELRCGRASCDFFVPVNEDTIQKRAAQIQAADPINSTTYSSDPAAVGREVCADHIAAASEPYHAADQFAACGWSHGSAHGVSRHGIENARLFVLVERRGRGAADHEDVLQPRAARSRLPREPRAGEPPVAQEEHRIRLGGERCSGGSWWDFHHVLEQGDGEVDAGGLRVTEDQWTRVPATLLLLFCQSRSGTVELTSTEEDPWGRLRALAIDVIAALGCSPCPQQLPPPSVVIEQVDHTRTLPAGALCDFDVVLHSEGTSRTTTYTDRGRPGAPSRSTSSHWKTSSRTRPNAGGAIRTVLASAR